MRTAGLLFLLKKIRDANASIAKVNLQHAVRKEPGAKHDIFVMREPNGNLPLNPKPYDLRGGSIKLPGLTISQFHIIPIFNGTFPLQAIRRISVFAVHEQISVATGIHEHFFRFPPADEFNIHVRDKAPIKRSLYDTLMAQISCFCATPSMLPVCRAARRCGGGKC